MKYKLIKFLRIYAASCGSHYSSHAVNTCDASHRTAPMRCLRAGRWHLVDWLLSMFEKSGRATAFISSAGVKDSSVFRQTLAAILWLACLCLLLNPGVLSAGVEQDAEGKEHRLLSNIRQLIFEGRRSGEGYFSADGSMMIFQSERDPDNPFYQIYLMDLETGDTHRVSTGEGKTTCGWIHPGGKKILFASSHTDPEARHKQREELEKRAGGQGSRYAWSFDEHYEIYESDLRGKTLRNLTQAQGYDAEGSWSPDGKLIAFASNRAAYSHPLTAQEKGIFANDKSYFMDIYVMNADGTHVRRLTDTPGYDGGPFFSPDGRRIVWRRFSKDGTTAEVWTMNIDGSDQRQLTSLGVMSWAPFYHPSGDYIIFTNNAQGYANFELYIVATAGQSKPVRVTHTPGFDGLPVFTPDGNRLAWSSSRTPDRKPQIFMADWDDKAARRLLGLGESATNGRPSADKPERSMPDLNQTVAAISQRDVRLHVSYLASEELQGRLTGTEGERLASAYVARVFESQGLAPAGDQGSYFQEFDFTAGVSVDAGNRLLLQEASGRVELRLDEDWRPLALSQTGEVREAEVVFAGYGIVAPAAPGFEAYDAYAELDVRDRWVMMFRYLPEDISPQYRQHLVNYFDLRYKAMIARDKGARGIILVSGPNANVSDPLIKLNSDTTAARVSIAAISVTDDVAQRLLRGTGKNLKDLQDRLDKGGRVKGFTCSEVKLRADIRLQQKRRTGRNVLARLNAGVMPGASAVIIGAHVDHIGHGEGHDSLASEEERGQVHHGADDNASGVGALLEIAQYLTDQKTKGRLALEHDIIFAAWSGEELGTLGSNHFLKSLGKEGVDNPKLAIVAYLNMDMIGRLDKQLYLQGTGSSSLWVGEIERRNAPIGLPIVSQRDSYLPTDATAFYLQEIPILSAFTGAHADYNTPRDTADKLNYEGIAQIANLMALITRSVAKRAEAPDYIAMEKPAASASRRNLRAYLGTIPEYGETDLKGVKLNGVAKGGPAEIAGLRRGDIIIELAGRKIENIYDYTYALNALKVAQAVEIVVLRAGEREVFEVTPGSRE